jgi:hypothetical protein
MSARHASRRLLAAAALSVAAHAALLAGSWLTPPEAPPEPPPLSVRLEPLPPPPAPPVVQKRPPPTQPRRVASIPRPVAAPDPAPAVVLAPAIDPEPTAVAAPEPVPAAEPAMVASVAPTEFRMPEAPPLPSFPRRGNITYLLTMGAEQTPVGRTVQTWEFEGDQYRLGSQSESTGLIEMIRPHRYHYLSQGKLSDEGLRPERFLASVKRGSRTEESLAVFNWNTHSVRLGRMPQQTTVPLPAGSQDVISFMYQLALEPPAPGRIRLPFTRGPKLEVVSFDVLPHEMIETPLGRLRTVPVVQVREQGNESLAIWLATDYRNLPVRIRFYNRDGETSGEQLVSEIRVSD